MPAGGPSETSMSSGQASAPNRGAPSLAECEEATQKARQTRGSMFNPTAGADAHRAADALCARAEAAECGRLVDWVRAGPVPNTSSRPGYSEPDAAVVALLQDRRFMAAFGRTYDQMPPAELTRYTSTIMPRCNNSQAFSALQPYERGAMARALSPYNGPAVTRARQGTDGIDALTAEAAQLPVTDAGYDRLIAMWKSGSDLQRNASPDAWARYQQAYAEAERRVGVPIEEQRVGAVLARSDGLDGLVAVYQMNRSLARAAVARELSAARSGQQARLRQKLDELGEQVAGNERKRIDAMDRGLGALERGVAWQKEYDSRLAEMAIPVKSIGSLKPYFLQHREATLTSARPELAAVIQRARSQAEINQTLAKYLLPSDSQSAAGTAVLTIASNHGYEIEKQAVIGSPSRASPSAPDEERPTRTPSRAPTGGGGGGGSGGSAVSRGEPSEEQMYDAVAAHLRGIADEVNRLSEDCRKNSKNSNPADALVCLTMLGTQAVGGGDSMKIARFSKLGCATANGRPGYNCDFELGMTGGTSQAAGRMIGNMVRQGSVSNGRFLQTGTGWRYFPPKGKDE